MHICILKTFSHVFVNNRYFRIRILISAHHSPPLTGTSWTQILLELQALIQHVLFGDLRYVL